SRPPAKPEEFTKAAAARLRAGLRAVEAYWRRVVLALALQMEHVLTPDQSEYVTYASCDSGPDRVPAPRFRVLDRSRDFPSGGIKPALSPTHGWPGQAGVPAAPLLQKLSALKALLAAPEARARRLAFHLARVRSGPLLPPGFGRWGVKRRYGTEVSAHYDALSTWIVRQSLARPQPLGPRPRAGPRIRDILGPSVLHV
ncbi:MAG: hypothetical protein AAGA24_06085, partial [Pseudomonadota bacterium]